MTRGNLNTHNNQVVVSLLSIKMNFPGCSSLKEKRSRLQPILNRVKKEFNAGFAETGLQDMWQSAWISCVFASNSGQVNVKVASEIIKCIEIRFPDEIIEEHHLERR